MLFEKIEKICEKINEKSATVPVFFDSSVLINMFKIHVFRNPSPKFHGFRGTHGTHANAATAHCLWPIDSGLEKMRDELSTAAS